MSILNIQTAQPTGLASVIPSVIYINTSDTYATVTTTGYLTQQASQGFTFNNTQMALVTTSDDGVVWLQVAITFSGSSVLNTVVSLVEITAPGDVILPTIANHLIVSTNVSGTLANLTGTAINNGIIQSGLLGGTIAGGFVAYPTTTLSGFLALTPTVNATGNFNTTISNGNMAQSTIYTVPDIGATTGGIVVSTSAVRMKTVAAAAAAGGAAAQSFTDAFCTTGSVIVGNWVTQANPASVLTIVPGSGSFVVTSSANAGAGTFSYIITK